jgi:uncharacterized protein (TIGR00369 family)
MSEANEILAKATSLTKVPPFFEFLGIMVEPLDSDSLCIKLAMRNELRGYSGDGALHGGVISAMIDIIGGIVVAWNLLKDTKEKPMQEQIKRLQNMSTVDLRIDYLQPGKGEMFTATASVLRTGKKLAVTRMELYNDEQCLIAVGTGTYTLG